MDEVFADFVSISREMEDEDERKKVITEIASLIDETHIRITMKVVKQFPDLHPDKPKI